MKKFDMRDKKDIRTFYQKHGCCVVSGLDAQSLLGAVQEQLKELVKLKANEVFPEAVSKDKDVLTDSFLKLYKHNRQDYVHVLDASRSLPALSGMCDCGPILEILKSLGLSFPSVRMVPGLRIDFSGDDEFLYSDLQDCHGNGGSSNAVICWIPLSRGVNDDMCMRVRPGSHELGRMPYKEIAVRPYLVLEDGDWKQRYPEKDVSLELGDMLVCHMHMIHSLIPVKGDYPRVALLLRYNDFKDQEYFESGWPLTYRLVSHKDKILLRTYSVE